MESPYQAIIHPGLASALFNPPTPYPTPDIVAVIVHLEHVSQQDRPA